MTKAIAQYEKNGYSFTYCLAKCAMHGDKRGSVKQIVHDGDTINVAPDGHFGVRFLGIDTPELTFNLPGSKVFKSTQHADWVEFLTNPFDPKWQPFSKNLDSGLVQYIQQKIGPTCGANHYKYADLAQKSLEAEVELDMNNLNQDNESFGFYLVFAYEILDGYGRFLAYINCDKKEEPRPESYNERQIQKGMASPYFIWPNVNPFRKESSIQKAVLKSGTAKDIADKDSKLKQARTWVKNARNNKIGIFDSSDPLMLEPFELRFLARRDPPNRWVIDLSKNDTIILKPQSYYKIPNSEDRLFIPSEYIPLFVENKWNLEQ